jgi:ATP-dependent DNA helicase RecQ
MRKPLDPALRKIVLERDGYHCSVPGCNETKRLNVHHIFPVKYGGQDTPANLITLCDIHHKGYHIEFSAYYPDSVGILKRMHYYLRSSLSKIRLQFGIDDGFDLLPYLEFLTGHKKFRPGQKETIRAILNGEDVLFVAPTGIGKSICYILPGVLAPKPTIVLSPTISLMVDATKNIWRKKIPATYINSELGKAEKKKRYEFINKQLYKFISMAPEAFFKSKDTRAKNLFKPNNYSYLVVDEAHTIKTYGQSFRHSYQQIGKLKNNLGDIQTIALTATASKDTQNEILESLKIPNAKRIVTGVLRDNIKIIRPYIDQPDEYYGRLKYLKRLIEDNSSSKILIFTLTIKKANELAEALSYDGIKALVYHSKIHKDEKLKIQSIFLNEQKGSKVLIATSAFGMGVDVSDIRHVVHYGPPLNLTDYVQQIGRAGRDNLQSYAHLLYDEGDENLLEFMKDIKTDNLQDYNYTESEIDELKAKDEKELKDMIEFATDEEIDLWEYIMKYFGEPRLSFWQSHGLKIFNVVLVVILLVLIALVVYFINYAVF